MSAALAPAPGPVQAACQIALGAAVRISLQGGWRPADMTEEGVVIEVVLPREAIRSQRISYAGTTATSRSSVPRYVVQTWTQRLVRREAELVVVAP